MRSDALTAARRGAGPAAVVLALLALVVAYQPWYAAGEASVSGAAATNSGATLLPGTALALLATRALVRRRWVRVGLTLVLLALSLGVCALGLRPPSADSPALADLLAPALVGSAAGILVTGWHWAYAGLGALLALTAALQPATVGRTVSRFDRGEVDSRDDSDLWRSLDAGVDPTERDAPPGS